MYIIYLSFPLRSRRKRSGVRSPARLRRSAPRAKITGQNQCKGNEFNLNKALPRSFLRVKIPIFLYLPANAFGAIKHKTVWLNKNIDYLSGYKSGKLPIIKIITGSGGFRLYSVIIYSHKIIVCEEDRAKLFFRRMSCMVQVQAWLIF